ncbi:MAG: hypothetical protein A2289_11250 [Deltaproteobacteria bacterium RIFOXYA12_FULL_58_15]|nr:MAG: hypothetical protein A2289_11250 [Deltaproteobacteria bacterium RIFOXYA12_FULL_58_15]OGR14987.1 MAG: hypothetical protein A2341_17735 [Deltaproteobacteria bacterium RIFOXYB12_FULL_58_9]
MAGDFSARLKFGHTRIGGSFIYRDLAFLLLNTPSLSPFVDLPDNVDAKPELAGALFADHNFESIGLTAGVSGGVRMPATAETTTTGLGGGMLLIIDDTTSFTPMPNGETVKPVVEAKATALIHISGMVGGAVELLWAHDPNRSRLTQDSSGIPQYKLTTRNGLGFNILLRGRF